MISIFTILVTNLFSTDTYKLDAPSKSEELAISKVDSLNHISFTKRFVDFDASIDYAKRAKSIADSIGYISGQAYAIKNIGTVKWNKGEFAEAKDLYYKSLVLYEELRDTSGISRLWNNIGLISITQDEYNVAIENLKSSIQFSKIVRDTAMLSTAYLNIGICYYYLKEYEAAISYHKKSIYYSLQSNDMLSLANNYSFLGAEYTILKQYKPALENLLKSLDIFEREDATRGMAHVDNLLSEYYLATNDFSKAIKYGEKALKISENIHSLINLFEATNHLSKAWAELSDFKKAYEYQGLAVKYQKELIDEKNKQRIAYITAEYNYEKELDKIEVEKQITYAKQQKDISARNMIIGIISIVAFFLAMFAIFLYRLNRSRQKKNQLLVSQKRSIDEKNVQLEKMNTELNTLNKTKDKFFSIIAHDLKNPIYNLNSIAQIISQDYDTMEDKEKMEYISLMVNSSEHVYSLLENLLTWSRSQRDKIDFMPAEGNLIQILTTTINGAKLSATNKNIKIGVDIKQDHAIFSDFNMLNTIVRNIISNAIKFTPKNGNIEISSHKNNQYVELSIKDSGVGMTKEKIETLFVTGENTSTPGTENESGTGLGLIICKEFALRNGGDIIVKSQKDMGTEFLVLIPDANPNA